MENTDHSPGLVSVHGGHSGQFCNHAQDSLEAIVQAYLEKGFQWVGITEHMPPIDDRFLAPDEEAAGLTARALYQRFAQYIQVCRHLQQTYAPRLQIFVGFETETCSGYQDFVPALVEEFQPDFFVGSLHHVRDMPFDFSPTHYREAAQAVGGIDQLYCHYFDQQYEMITAIQPRVVGHFDYIRIHDPNYASRLKKTEIWSRIERNLELIRNQNAILDFNVRALRKGAMEPYISRPILEVALALGIPVVPGDDSHGVAEVGSNLDRALAILQEMGADIRWATP